MYCITNHKKGVTNMNRELTWQDNADELLVIADKAYSKLCHRLGLRYYNSEYNNYSHKIDDMEGVTDHV